MKYNILSRFDDIISFYFVDNLCLWFKTTRMNKDFQIENVNINEALEIIKSDIVGRSPHCAISQASKSFLNLPYFQNFMVDFTEKDTDDFKNHLKRYLQMFFSYAGYEVTSTKRYTGNMEACIVATKNWKAGDHVKYCTGGIADLSQDEDAQLEKDGSDFSVVFSEKKKRSCLFLGPARFMNHDCESNCEFLITGNTVSFKVKRDIACGEEMTVFYGSDYFGKENCECLCASCEKFSKGHFSKNVTIKDEPGLSIDVDKESNRRSYRKKQAIDYCEGYKPKFSSISKKYKLLQSIERLTKKYNKLKIASTSPRLRHCCNINVFLALGNKHLSDCVNASIENSISSAPSCCFMSHEYPAVIIPDGPEMCARCYRHFMIFDTHWPHRKEVMKNEIKRKSSSTSLDSSSSDDTVSTLVTEVNTFNQERKLEFEYTIPQVFALSYNQLKIDNMVKDLNVAIQSSKEDDISLILGNFFGHHSERFVKPEYDWLFVNTGTEYSEARLKYIENQVFFAAGLDKKPKHCKYEHLTAADIDSKLKNCKYELPPAVISDKKSKKRKHDALSVTIIDKKTKKNNIKILSTEDIEKIPIKNKIAKRKQPEPDISQKSTIATYETDTQSTKKSCRISIQDLLNPINDI